MTTAETMEPELIPGLDGVIVLDQSWAVVSVNEEAAHLLGRPREALRGANFWELFPEASGSLFAEGCRGALARQEDVAFEDYFTHLDRWVSVRAEPSAGGLVVSLGGAGERARVSELRRLLEQARRGEARYRALLDGMAEGVAETTPDGQFVVVNRAFAQMLGYASGEELMAIVPNAAELYVDATRREMYVRTFADTDQQVIEVEMRRRDGSSLWIRARGTARHSPIGGLIGVQSIMEDITSVRDTERDLREAAERVELTFNRNPMPLVTLDLSSDTTGLIVDANRAAEELLGFGHGELIGTHATQHMMAEDRDRDMGLIRGTMSDPGERVTFETRRRHRDGNAIPVSVTAGTFHSASGKTYIVAAVEDIRLRRAAEDQVTRSYDHTVAAIARVAEVRDPYTAGHQERVAQLASAIAKHLGLTDDQIRGIWIAATIHDIGKVAVSTDILAKPGRLSPPEFELIKAHPQIGHDIVAHIEFPWPVAEMVLQHHERFDGSGYPHALRGDEIGTGSQILSVADVVEAMTHFRPYRPGLGLNVALDEIRDGRGTRYAPDAVDSCLEIFASGVVDWTSDRFTGEAWYYNVP